MSCEFEPKRFVYKTIPNILKSRKLLDIDIYQYQRKNLFFQKNIYFMKFFIVKRLFSKRKTSNKNFFTHPVEFNRVKIQCSCQNETKSLIIRK